VTQRWAFSCNEAQAHRRHGLHGLLPIAGVIWQHVHYIVGLQRLGHDVYYIEDSARIPYNAETFDTSNDLVTPRNCWPAWPVNLILRIAGLFAPVIYPNFHGRFVPKEIRQHYKSADAILNVCGAQEFNDDLLASDRILYVESDPGVEQIKVDQSIQSTIDYLRRHHALFTFGENVGTKEFPVPIHGLKWLSTRQPVVTDLWKTRRPPPSGAVFTSVANWSTSGLKDIIWRGEKYLWSKSREFMRFVNARSSRGNI